MRNPLILASIFTLLFACKKDDPVQPDIPQEMDEKNYMPLEVGNYWIYQTFEVEESGAETKVGSEDSIAVTNDTSINGKRYFTIKGTDFYNPSWTTLKTIRDSSGYLVSPIGHIQFSDSNFEDTLYHYVDSNTYTVVGKMVESNDSIIVPAGSYSVLDYRKTYQFHLSVQINPRNAHTYYSNNVGIVLETSFFAASTSTLERRLVRYHVQ